MDTTNIKVGYKPKQMRLREMPKDVRDILLDVQTTKKKKCNCHFSLEQTIYMIIRKANKQDDNNSE
jgi:hypothetical protein